MNSQATLVEEVPQQSVGSEVTLSGFVHAIRKLGKIAFVLLRDRSGIIQLIAVNEALVAQVSGLGLETPVRVTGRVAAAQSNGKPASNGIHLISVEPLSASRETIPVEVNKSSKVDSLSLSAMLDYRPLTLRAEKVRAVFKLEAEFCRAFREFLTGQQFTEIHSPKLVATGTEGGAALFAVDYFGKKAFLAQSPQFYKQMMVGVFERVFEIGPVYRAEEHDTTRHLNEYISMDFEMGFIESEQDVMAMQVKLLQHMFASVRENCEHELALWGATVPVFSQIPQLTLEEAHTLLRTKLGWKRPADAESLDLDADAEKLLCEHFQTAEGVPLVYVTSYPKDVRPFYAMPTAEGMTHSFDLLYNGLEITTGGQRIHEYEQLVGSIAARGMNPADFGDYLQCFKYGMPPHGGLAIGLERLAKQLLGLPNVKLASLFPRDRNRLTP
jgi:nondiscriminating aspartyl-tRNA synthetase